LGSEVRFKSSKWAPDFQRGRLIYDLSDDLTEEEVIEYMWKEGGATEENPQL